MDVMIHDIQDQLQRLLDYARTSAAPSCMSCSYGCTNQIVEHRDAYVRKCVGSHSGAFHDSPWIDAEIIDATTSALEV